MDTIIKDGLKEMVLENKVTEEEVGIAFLTWATRADLPILDENMRDFRGYGETRSLWRVGTCTTRPPIRPSSY